MKYLAIGLLALAGCAADDAANADPGPAPDIALLPTRLPPPWAGGGARHAVLRKGLE